MPTITPIITFRIMLLLMLLLIFIIGALAYLKPGAVINRATMRVVTLIYIAVGITALFTYFHTL